MSVAVLTTAAELTAETYDKVKQELGDTPPEGCLFQAVGETDEGLRIISVWYSKDDYETFRDDRFLPAIEEAGGEDAQKGISDAEVYDLSDTYVKPPDSDEATDDDPDPQGDESDDDDDSDDDSDNDSDDDSDDDDSDDDKSDDDSDDDESDDD